MRSISSESARYPNQPSVFGQDSSIGIASEGTEIAIDGELRGADLGPNLADAVCQIHRRGLVSRQRTMHRLCTDLESLVVSVSSSHSVELMSVEDPLKRSFYCTPVSRWLWSKIHI